MTTTQKPPWFIDFEKRNAQEHDDLRQEMNERFAANTEDIQRRDQIIHEDIEALRSELNGFRQNVDDRFKQVDTRFDAVMAELRIIKGRLP